MIKGEKILKPHWCTCNNFSVYKPDLWSIWFRYITFLKILYFEKKFYKNQTLGLGFPGIGYRI